MRKLVLGFPTGPDINLPVQSQKMARSLKFQIYEGKEYCTIAEAKTKALMISPQPCRADLRLCFRVGKNLVFS